MRGDARAHLTRLRTRHAADRAGFGDLRRVLLADRGAGVSASPQSATSALRWMTRMLRFVHRFFTLFLETCDDSAHRPSSPSLPSVEFCLSRAYEETLSRHHDIVVRSVYSVSNLVTIFWKN